MKKSMKKAISIISIVFVIYILVTIPIWLQDNLSDTMNKLISLNAMPLIVANLILVRVKLQES